jgi:pyruvate formate lyase activating enzyme
MFHLKKFQKYILPYLDFIYFDLKLISPEESRKHTGCSNEEIIINFLYLYYESEIPVVARIPLIPDITTTKNNLTGIAQFLQKHGITACSVIPYNPMWQDKAVKNGINIKYSRIEFMSKEEEENCIQSLIIWKGGGHGTN